MNVVIDAYDAFTVWGPSCLVSDAVKYIFANALLGQ
jgi:hypothetical protein